MFISMYIIAATSFFWLNYFYYIYFICFFFLRKVTVSDIKINLLKFTKYIIRTIKLMSLTLVYIDTTGNWNAVRNHYSGKNSRYAFSYISVHVISVFDYSWIMMFFNSKNYLVKYFTLQLRKRRSSCDICL